MELVRIDTQRAYQEIRNKIITLELSPGTPIDEGQLARDLSTGVVPVREAIKLLAHDHLVEIPPHGIYVSDINVPDLEEISEIRILLESFCARQAANRANADDVVILETLCQEMASIPPSESQRLFIIDHKFHEAIARAAHNKYLAQTLERFYGLSQRLWYLVLPKLGFLPASVEEHLDLVQAIITHDSELAERIMNQHVSGFYDKVREILINQT
jgi:DNA-binding GntR family transcriptional regulator